MAARLNVRTGEPVDVPSETLFEWWQGVHGRSREEPAALVREGDRFVERSFDRLDADARAVAGGLADAEVGPGDRVAIRAGTCYEWSVVDLACHLLGAVLVPVYPTFPPDRAAYVVEDAGANVLVADFEQPEEVADLVDHRFRLSNLPERELDPEELAGEERELDDPATIVYTSGTTGDPKGCVLTHRNARATLAQLDAHFSPSGDVVAGFLPLSHTYQRFANYHAWDRDAAVAFMDVDDLKAELTMARPTMLPSVPRLYERMYDAIRTQAAEMEGPKGRLFGWALEIAGEYGRAASDGCEPSTGLALKHAVADRLVLSKIRERLGLDRVEYSITGAASIDSEVLYFFWGLGIPLLEVYGATELTAAGTYMPPDRFRPGTVGLPSPGVELALESDGEVLARGPNVFQGYWNDPEKTEEAFLDADGGDPWYRTGDIGEFEDLGDGTSYLRIVDRKANIAVLDTGKNVAPAHIESSLKRSRYVGEAMVIAEGRKFVTALIEPAFEAVVEHVREAGVEIDEDDFERDGDELVAVPRDVIESEPVQQVLEAAVEETNETLAKYERIRRFTALERTLSIDRGELTPTLKKRREVVGDRFADRIEALYED